MKTIRVRTYNGGHLKVRVAFQKGTLAVHRDAVYAGRTPPGWTVTHVPSRLAIGRRIVSFEKAKKFLKECEPMTDWAKLTPGSFEAGRVGRLVDQALPETFA